MSNNKNFKSNYFHKKKSHGPKANERIRALDVQVIGSGGNNLGTLPLNKAIEIAKEEGLDLIEISPNANPQFVKLWIWVSISMIFKKKQI